MSRSKRALLSLGTSLAVVTVVGAQDGPSCQAATAAVNALARPDILSDSSASFRTLFACPISGPPQIARIWQMPGLSEAEAQRLLAYTVSILDTRLVTALLNVAESAAANSIARRAAVAALLPYVDSTASTAIVTLSRPARRSATIARHFDAPTYIFGSSPPSASTLMLISSRLLSIAMTTTDRQLQNVAISSLRVTYHAVPDLLVLPPSLISLSNVCGNRFRIRYRGLLNLTVRLVVDGSPESRSVRLEMPEEQVPETDTTFTMSKSGNVRVFHRTQPLATAPHSNLACS